MKDNTVSDFKFDLITLDDHLQDLGIDSLGFATLLWELESHFNITDPSYADELNGHSTIGDMILVYRDLGHEISIS